MVFQPHLHSTPGPRGGQGGAETRASPGIKKVTPALAHLLEEPDIENRKGAVQHVVQCQEPAFIQRLGRGEGRDTAVSHQPADAKLSEMEMHLYLRRPTQAASAPVE